MLGDRPGSGLVNRCEHIVRDGMECVGPFFDEYETDCGFWEEGVRSIPQPSNR